MEFTTADNREFPAWLRWGAGVWLLVWIPAYWRFWGLANFLHLCDVAALLTCIGVMANSALLISSQAVSSLLIDTVWVLDVAWRLLSGRHLIGGTEYLFDERYPLWVRMLSLFHVVLPFLLLWAIHRIGYDRRAWKLQSAIAVGVFVAARFTDSAKNINFAFTDPFFHRQLGPGPLHVAICLAMLVFVVYALTHLALKKLFRAPSAVRHS